MGYRDLVSPPLQRSASQIQHPLPPDVVGIIDKVQVFHRYGFVCLKPDGMLFGYRFNLPAQEAGENTWAKVWKVFGPGIAIEMRTLETRLIVIKHLVNWLLQHELSGKLVSGSTKECVHCRENHHRAV
ncbi:hypothetical protein ES705_40404 [subsurface metagenome]